MCRHSFRDSKFGGMDGNAKNVLKWATRSVVLKSTARANTGENQVKVRDDHIRTNSVQKKCGNLNTCRHSFKERIKSSFQFNSPRASCSNQQFLRLWKKYSTQQESTTRTRRSATMWFDWIRTCERRKVHDLNVQNEWKWLWTKT